MILKSGKQNRDPRTAAVKSGGQFFAFDPDRAAIVLVAGDKQGKNQKLFYQRLIKIADRRFDSHLRQAKAAKIVTR